MKKTLTLLLLLSVAACDKRRCLKEHTEWMVMTTPMCASDGNNGVYCHPIVTLMPVSVCDEYEPLPAEKTP